MSNCHFTAHTRCCSFLESEVELDEELKGLRVLAAAPEHYSALLASDRCAGNLLLQHLMEPPSIESFSPFMCVVALARSFIYVPWFLSLLQPAYPAVAAVTR